MFSTAKLLLFPCLLWVSAFVSLGLQQWWHFKTYLHFHFIISQCIPHDDTHWLYAFHSMKVCFCVNCMLYVNCIILLEKNKKCGPCKKLSPYILTWFILRKFCRCREVPNYNTVPSKRIGTAGPVLLFLLYSKDIWVWDQEINIRWLIIILAFVSWHLHLDMSNFGTWAHWCQSTQFLGEEKYRNIKS